MGSACFHYVASSISVFFQKPLILKSLILLTLFNSFWWTLALGIEGNFCIIMASLRPLYFSIIESNIMALIFLLVFKAQSFPCLMALSTLTFELLMIYWMLRKDLGYLFGFGRWWVLQSATLSNTVRQIMYLVERLWTLETIAFL